MKPIRQVTEHSIAAQTHGRYLVWLGEASTAPMLIGFHGYGETAEDELRRLQAIPGIAHWTVVSIQGLHHFYRRRTNEVVASWMTRQNRGLAIADNITYVQSVVNSLCHESAVPLILTGFSQGVAMAFRAAGALKQRVMAVIACGGDIPPDVEPNALARIPTVLIGRGVRDEWYTPEKHTADAERLRAAGVVVQSEVIDTGHEWTPEFSEISARFIVGALRR